MLRATGKAVSQIVDLRFYNWIDTESIAGGAKTILNPLKSLVSTQKPDRVESFTEALHRLNLTEQDLIDRLKEFKRLMLINLYMALGIFIYSLYITVKYSNFMGLCMGITLTIYALTKSLQFNFWMFQIKNRKLGCSLREWWSSTQ